MSDGTACLQTIHCPLALYVRRSVRGADRWGQLRTAVRRWLLSPCAAAIGVGLMMWLIGGVSAFDAFLTLKYQESLSNLEVNPCCRWIMQLRYNAPVQAEALALFLGLKMVGTVNVLVIIKMLFLWRAHWGLAVGGWGNCVPVVAGGVFDVGRGLIAP